MNVNKIRSFCRVFRIIVGLVLIGVGVSTIVNESPKSKLAPSEGEVISQVGASIFFVASAMLTLYGKKKSNRRSSLTFTIPPCEI